MSSGGRGGQLDAERKLCRRQLTDDANIEITGRDRREREPERIIDSPSAIAEPLMRAAQLGAQRQSVAFGGTASRLQRQTPGSRAGQGSQSRPAAWAVGSTRSSRGSTPIGLMFIDLVYLPETLRGHEDLAFVIDGTRQIHPLAGDGNDVAAGVSRKDGWRPD